MALIWHSLLPVGTGRGLVHGLFGEREVLVFCPELHLVGLRAADFAHLAHGVGLEAVVAHRMVEYACENVVHGAQVGLRVLVAVLAAAPHELRLLCQDVCGADARKPPVPEIRRHFRLDDVLFGRYLFQRIRADLRGRLFTASINS